jgi:hypothetical protein
VLELFNLIKWMLLDLFRSRRSLEAEVVVLRDRPTAPRSPWQNGYAERLIGSIRRECLDHVIIIGEPHLRHILRSYQQYYNSTRTHLSLAKDSPLTRSVQAVSSILPLPIIGGLHHHYVRIRFATGTTLEISQVNGPDGDDKP